MKPARRGVFIGMNLRTASALAALAATLLVAGCGGSDDDTNSAASAPAPAYDYGSGPKQAEAPAEAATIKAVAGALGTMLVDGEGRTLYLWEADTGAKSTCEGPCASAWPPLTTVDPPKISGGGLDRNLLGTSKRADGTLGVTYAGHPLYYFQGDGAAGDANGQGSDGFGAKWWAVAPDGSAIER
jgi:predicted lipoprotein with Yx(FWY)xxD motif